MDAKRRLQDIEEDEVELGHCASFGSADALLLGNKIIKVSRNREFRGDGSEIGIAVRIVRESDQTPLFQYFADDKDLTYATYLDGKRLATLATGHSSAWVEIDHKIRGTWDAMFDKNSPELPGAGCFPLYAGDTIAATVTVSGLHEGRDHLVITEALRSIRLSAGTDSANRRFTSCDN